MAGKLTAHLRLRMPEVLRERLAHEAEKSQRSLNSEILWRLGLTLEKEWQELIAQREEAEKREQELFDRYREDPELRKKVAEIIAKIPKKTQKK
jgi:hypothetical protein